MVEKALWQPKTEDSSANGGESMRGIKLTELIDVKILQRIQDAFSEFTGMAALITDEKGVPVTKGSGFTQLCMNLVRKCDAGSRRCEECDRMGAINTYESGTPVVYTCHVGLTDYAAPIMVNEYMIGSVIGGQVRKEPPDEAQERAMARELGIDEEIYLEASKKIHLVDEEQVRKAAKFLTELAAVLSEMAYKNYIALQNSIKLEKISRSQTNQMVDIYSNMEKTISLWIESAKLSLENTDYEAMASSLEVLIRNGREILTAFGNTVEYAKMTDSGISLKETAYNLKRIINEAIKLQRNVIKEKGNRVQIKTSDDMSVCFFGDMGRLKQLMSTLIKIGNNFMKDGIIEMYARAEKVDYADMLVIEVRDQGNGMQESSIVALNKYMQHVNMNLLNCTEEEEKELFILRMLVEQLSGRIVFESMPDGGTVTKVIVPQLEMK